MGIGAIISVDTMMLVRALCVLLLAGSKAASTTPPVVSRLPAALAPQGFTLNVTEYGAMVLTAGGTHLSTISSSFSEPGPLLHNFSALPSSTVTGWTVTVDRSRAASGVWLVRAEAKGFRVLRAVTLDPPQAPRRVLVNDTISTPASSGDDPSVFTAAEGAAAAGAGAAAGTPGPTDVVGISIKHTATVADTAALVDTAVVPGTFGGWQCGTDGNPGDTCASPCLDPNVKNSNNGRPDVFANRSGFGIGLTALDDVFRVHAQTHQMAMATGPRMKGMDCAVSDPPTISLADPSFGMRDKDDVYTLEWAVYPFIATVAGDEHVPPAEPGADCTDYYCFVTTPGNA